MMNETHTNRLFEEMEFDLAEPTDVRSPGWLKSTVPLDIFAKLPTEYSQRQ